MKLKAFPKGGVHPKESKYTEDKPIQKAHIPKLIRLPMAMHLGAPAKVLVKEGDTVEEGQLIGEAAGFVSANIHSSVPGKVVRVVKDNTLTLKNVEFVEIETGGNFKNWLDKKKDYSKLSAEQLLEKIKNAGIVGLGGATFPTHVKFAPNKKKTELLIINGAECEPFLTIDHRMMLEKTDEIIEGINMIRKILGVKDVIIGIEANKEDAVRTFQDALGGNSDIKVEMLRTYYPQGGEKQLIEAITGKQVPSGGLPLDIGVVVANVATVYAVFEAVAYEKPLIERGLTYTGLNIPQPGNYKVRIGSPIQDLIDEFGIAPNHGTIIAGGPMMGLEVEDTNLPVMKGTSGIVVLSKKQDYTAKDMPCIRCTACVHVCPIGLFPFRLGTLVNHTRIDEAADLGLMDCIECGSCAFVCPSSIPLVGLFRFGKGMWRRRQAKK